MIIVSNRVGSLSATGSAGGLAVAVGDALKAHGGIWFGWNGEISGTDGLERRSAEGFRNVEYITFPLPQRDYDEYYLGYSNRVLWPVMHYRLDLAVFESHFLNGYRRANARFASLLDMTLDDDDLVWVHDYHLIPLAAELRARGHGNAMGFFLHIPFPPRDILVAMPQHEWLVRALFSYDVVGFQTRTDLQNFQQYLIEEAGGEILPDNRVRAFGRTIIADAYPISIDVDAFSALAHSKEADEQIKLLQQRNLARINVIGVERLDYTKGLPERFRAFRKFLEISPTNRKRVSLMQIAPPTRETVEAYTDIREELEGLSGAINGEYADFDWTPLRYIHRAVPRSTLAALFRGSQVGLVTPLRDGMNLVAKEYVAAQDQANPGVLVLSAFAGAAEELGEALIINPFDIESVARALEQAIAMPLAERKERHAALLRTIRRNDISHWRERFVSDLKRRPMGAVA